MTVELTVRSASAFTGRQREAFKELVLKDPQVQKDGLSARIAGAHYLAFLYLGGELVGVNAIKNNRPYQRTLEDRAGVALPDTEYLGEVGYLHVDKNHRRARLADVLILATFAVVKGKGLFATIQSMNVGSRRLFESHGFTQVGNSWPSNKVKDQVNLYVRPARQ
ncbi:GNAT family N-acetyltransferase [Mesorhizobium xinjiangense]|uniref:GNAT family N-acetyltransferase n=1 Tax=Mesorhizobium xinjiangense TaxID=2678685 RepID=UPI0012EE244A|nr:GNAT family N-acetyltransferase [Mesorhizobium xinjiangense]